MHWARLALMPTVTCGAHALGTQHAPVQVTLVTGNLQPSPSDADTAAVAAGADLVQGQYGALLGQQQGAPLARQPLLEALPLLAAGARRLPLHRRLLRLLLLLLRRPRRRRRPRLGQRELVTLCVRCGVRERRSSYTPQRHNSFLLVERVLYGRLSTTPVTPSLSYAFTLRVDWPNVNINFKYAP
jgi:hypothetical protein